MKGLLLKEIYSVKKYFKIYIALVGLVAAIAIFVGSGMELFIAFFPCIICSSIPTNLVAYDEKNRWTTYSATMPYTKFQIVSSKYMIGLIIQAIVLLFSAFINVIHAFIFHTFSSASFVTVFWIIFMSSVLAILANSVFLPLVFKFGTEKGRLAALFVTGIFYGIIIYFLVSFINGIGLESLQSNAKSSVIIIIFATIAITAGIYALSWYISYVIFKRREL